jgi:hypothetical protein
MTSAMDTPHWTKVNLTPTPAILRGVSGIEARVRDILFDYAEVLPDEVEDQLSYPPLDHTANLAELVDALAAVLKS